MIFIPKKDNEKFGFITGKGIELNEKEAKILEKKGLGIIKIVKKAGRPKNDKSNNK